MKIPGLGKFVKDESLGWYCGEAVSVPVLGGETCRIVFESYDDDPAPEELHRAAKNFLALGRDVLRDAEEHVYRYYEDGIEARDSEDDEDPVEIAAPPQVWRHVQWGEEAIVKRREGGEGGVYLSLECGCDWESEHGLEIVFQDGLRVSKVGPCDGYCTHADAYDDDALEGVVYPPRESF